MEHPHAHQLTKEQKVGFSLLLTFGICAVALGLLQMRNTVYGPFAYKAPEQPAIDPSTILDEETARLQSIDTDQDGINDYEELYFHQTSPYLPDTDSDGIRDLDEITAGDDPLCPKGDDCASDSVGGIRTQTTTLPGIVQEEPTNNADPLLFTQAQISQGENVNVERILNDPDAVRDLLEQTGQITRAQLDAIPDKDILALVQSLAASDEQEEDSPTSTTSTP